MPDFSIITWVIVVFAALAAGFIDSIAGGGGLITLPVLLAAGLPPHLAIGTNKVQSVFGTAAAAWRCTRGGLVPWKRIGPGFVMSLTAAGAGAWSVGAVNAGILERVLPFILAGLWVYLALKPELGESEGPPCMPRGLFYPAAGTLFGFYDGFLGPGTGAFWSISQVSLAGMNLKGATAAAKPLNFASNMGALAVFLMTGDALYPVGLTMAAGTIAGSSIGSHLVIRHQPRFIRPFILVVVAAAVVKLLRDQYFS